MSSTTSLPGIGHNNPPVELSGSQQRDLDIDEAATEAQRHFEKAETAKKTSRNETRQALQWLYIILFEVNDSDVAREKLKAAVFREKIRVRKANDPTILIVRYYGKISNADKANRFANVLREAYCRKIPKRGLTAYLSKKGQGIDALSKAYQQREQDQESTDNDSDQTYGNDSKGHDSITHKSKLRRKTIKKEIFFKVKLGPKSVDRLSKVHPGSLIWFQVKVLNGRSGQSQKVTSHPERCLKNTKRSQR